MVGRVDVAWILIGFWDRLIRDLMFAVCNKSSKGLVYLEELSAEKSFSD